ncbi:hypothetical protein BC835DRAFT_1410940 [Cytidiella melzeri]|nr:hypothetical protein BC835DRAFT_1410940 [Cytidiella melzeri]
MRRLVAVFSSKRSDKSDVASNASSMDRPSTADPPKVAPSKRPLFFKTKSLSRASAISPDSRQRKSQIPPVLTVTEHAPSSSSSSSGAPSTPHDDSDSVGHPPLGSKPWTPLTYLHDKVLPPIGAQDPSRPYVPRVWTASRDDDDDLASTHSIEMPQLQLPATAKVIHTSPITPSAYCRAIAGNALEPPFSPPPLLVVSNAPLYPRSCNSPRQLRRPIDDLRYRTLQARFLRRLDSTPADRDLTPFAKRNTLPSKPLSLLLDDNFIPLGCHVASSSLGLRQWIERPCFEDRVLVYLPGEPLSDFVRCERVSATAAVEALGYSEVLDALAGIAGGDVAVLKGFFTTSPTSLTPPLSSNPSTASLNSLPPSPAPYLVTDVAISSGQGMKPFPTATHRPFPSPLRIAGEANVQAKATPSPSTYLSSHAVASLPASPASPASSVPSPKIIMTPPANDGPKTGVRFVEDDKEDKEDTVPLDYVMRIKQARDQKAKFLAAERARRQSVQGQLPPSSVRPSLDNPQQMREDLKRVAEERKRLEEEKKRYEAQRRQQEEERRRWEKERAAWQREKRLAEEERKQRAYADEIVEARQRREGSRQGSMPKIDKINSWDGDKEKERERKGSEARPRYSRAKYDDLPGIPRREASDPGIATASSTSLRLQIPSNSSPGSSGPPSVATGSLRGSSRPPSMYSTPPSSASAVDVRQRRESKASRRASVMSDGSALGAQQTFMQPPMPSSFPWGVAAVPPGPMAMNMTMIPVPLAMQMPMMQMPMMPYVDMPLLPPSAPFMQQSGPRQQRSHSASPTRTSHSPNADRGQGESGSNSPHGSHRRAPSDELPKRHGDASRSPSYATTHSSPYSAKQSPSTTSFNSDRIRGSSSASHQQTFSTPVRPTPVQARSQPGFQNLSRPPSDRRQTMIR